MKTIKLLLLAVLLASCSTDEIDDRQEPQGECECERIEVNVITCVNSSGTGFNVTEEEHDRFPVLCQDEVEEFYFYEENNGRCNTHRYYTIECNNTQNKEDANYRILCSGNGFMVITNDSFWKINGEVVTEQEATDKCNEINNG